MCGVSKNMRGPLPRTISPTQGHHKLLHSLRAADTCTVPAEQLGHVFFGSQHNLCRVEPFRPATANHHKETQINTITDRANNSPNPQPKRRLGEHVVLPARIGSACSRPTEDFRHVHLVVRRVVGLDRRRPDLPREAHGASSLGQCSDM